VTPSGVVDAVILGVVEALSEFLPISSTGHLLLVSDILGFRSPGDVFEVVIQLGAILSICVLFFARLARAVIALPSDPGARRFAASILIAFMPAAVLGAALHGFIKGVLFSPVVVAVSLVVGGVVILVIERWHPPPRLHNPEALPLPTALAIGFAQVLAMIPGVSRSGATIMGALLLGVDRKAAAEFSFFLAIPTMFGAAAYDLYKSRALMDADSLWLIAIGFIAAFVAGLAVVDWLLRFVQRHTFKVFGWYRIVFGLIVLAALHYTGGL
jgi:undecaprenyl-diphosphatase